MGVERDWLVRLVEGIAAALARALGLRRAGAFDAARAELEQAARDAAGLELALLEGLSPGSAARLVREPARLAALARLALERSRVEADAGDAGAAAGWEGRAAELGRLALRGGASLDPEVAALAGAGPA
jgi:hypothetical protein